MMTLTDYASTPAVVTPLDTSDGFELRHANGLHATLTVSAVTLGQTPADAVDELAYAADWLFRLAHDHDMGGFQEYSAQYLGEWLERDQPPLAAESLRLIAAVLTHAWQNRDFRIQTRRNAALAMVALARHAPALLPGLVADVLLGVGAEAEALDPSDEQRIGQTVQCCQEAARAVAGLLANGAETPPEFCRLVVEALTQSTVAGLDLTEALATLDAGGVLDADGVEFGLLARLEQIDAALTAVGRSRTPVTRALLDLFERQPTAGRTLIEQITDRLRHAQDADEVALQRRFFELLHDRDIKRTVAQILAAEVSDAGLAAETRQAAAEAYADTDVRDCIAPEEPHETYIELNRQLSTLLAGAQIDREVLSAADVQRLGRVLRRCPAVSVQAQLAPVGLRSWDANGKADVVGALVDLLESDSGPTTAALEAVTDVELGDLGFHSISGKAPPAPVIYRLAAAAASLMDHADTATAVAAMRCCAALHVRHVPRRNQLVYEATTNKDAAIAGEVLDELESRLGPLEPAARDAVLARGFSRGPGRMMSHVLTYQSDTGTLFELARTVRRTLIAQARADEPTLRAVAETCLVDTEVTDLALQLDDSDLAALVLQPGDTPEPSRNEVLTALLDNWADGASHGDPPRRLLEHVDTHWERLLTNTRQEVLGSLANLLISPDAERPSARAASRFAIEQLQRLTAPHRPAHGLPGALTALVTVLRRSADVGLRMSAVSAVLHIVGGVPERIQALDKTRYAELVDAALGILVDPELDDDPPLKEDALRVLATLLESGGLPTSRSVAVVAALARVLDESPLLPLRRDTLGVLDTLLTPNRTTVQPQQRYRIQERLLEVALSSSTDELRLGALQLLAGHALEDRLRERLIDELSVAARSPELKAAVNKVYKSIGHSPARRRAGHLAVQLTWAVVGALIGYAVSLVG